MIACVCMQAAHVHMPIHVTSSLLQQGFGKYILQTGASWMNCDMGTKHYICVLMSHHGMVLRYSDNINFIGNIKTIQ